MEGWRPVEDLVRWGFAHAPVVMANEAHHGLADPGEPLLVWRGNGHATKEECGEWSPMGWHFRAISGIDPFVIDQTVTVDFGDGPRPWVRELLASASETLAAHGGTAGILRDQAPPPLDCRVGVDALVVSTDNELTE